jgi:ArsR family transcriptional regulator
MEAKQFQKIAKALADPRRFEILSRIAGVKEMACSSLRCDLPITAATLSHHIKELENAGLVDVRKDARFIHLKLRRKVWRDYLAQLSKI